MALFALTSRILLALSVVISPIVCCCATGTAADVYDGGSLQPLAMLDSGLESANQHAPCCKQPAPRPSHTPSPSSDKEHAPGSCPDCPESVLSVDNMPGATLMGSSPTFPDTLSFTGPLQLVGRLNPASPHRGMVAKPQGEFGGDSLRALFRLLTI